MYSNAPRDTTLLHTGQTRGIDHPSRYTLQLSICMQWHAGTRASYMSQTISQTPLNIHTSIVIHMHLCKYTHNIRWSWHNANRIMLVKHATPVVVWLVAAQRQSVALTDCFLHKQKMVVATNQSSQLHDTHTASYMQPHACQQAHPHDSPCRYLLYMWMLQVHCQYYVIKH